MTDHENRIINLLKKNARLSNADIGDILGLSAQAVADIIKQLEDANIIAQYTTIINEDNINAPKKIRAMIQLSVRPEEKAGFNEIARQISKYDQVIDHYLISGSYDYHLVVEGSTMEEISSLIEVLASLPNVNSTGTHFILRTYKEKNALLDSQSKETRIPLMP